MITDQDASDEKHEAQEIRVFLEGLFEGVHQVRSPSTPCIEPYFRRKHLSKM